MRCALTMTVPGLLAGMLALRAETLPQPAFGEFAFVPHRRQFRLTPLYERDHANDWFGADGTKTPLPGSKLTTDSGGVLVEYGIAPFLAADATLGVVAQSGPNAGGSGSASTWGLADTRFGLRWQLLDEDLKESEPFVPTLTLRLGGVAPGSYDEKLPFAPGPGASGLETQALMSNSLGQSPFALYGDFGWRWLVGGVPNHLFGSAGIGVTLPFGRVVRVVRLNAAYVFDRATSGTVVTSDNWASVNWPLVRATGRGFQAGLAVTDNGGRCYRVVAGLVLQGNNAPASATLGVQVEIPFKKLKRRHSLWQTDGTADSSLQ